MRPSSPAAGERMDNSTSSSPLRHGARPHVAILSFPFYSHTAAIYALGRKLAAASPSATSSLLSTVKANALLPRFARPARYPNLRLLAVADGLPGGFPAGMEEAEEVELFLDAAPGAFRAGMEEAVREAGGAGISCVVSDSFFCSAAGQLAGEMGVPLVLFWPCAPRSLLVHLYADVLRRRLAAGSDVITVEEKDVITA